MYANSFKFKVINERKNRRIFTNSSYRAHGPLFRYFLTAIRRSKMRKESQARCQQDYDAFIPDDDVALLATHRCLINLIQ
jgi:hypothetical protein